MPYFVSKSQLTQRCRALIEVSKTFDNEELEVISLDEVNELYRPYADLVTSITNAERAAKRLLKLLEEKK